MKLKLLVVFASVVIALAGHAQGTAFTYQGRLNDGGNPANGSYDFTFTIFGTNHGGAPITQTITNTSVAVSNGLFKSSLDFGSFLNGNPAWLEIGVRSKGNGSFAILSPRQELTPAPYAIFANTASNVIGTINGNQIASGSITSSQLAAGAASANLQAGESLTNQTLVTPTLVSPLIPGGLPADTMSTSQFYAPSSTVTNVFWGDSLTYGNEDGTGNSFPLYVQEYSGMPSINEGFSGMGSTYIRQQFTAKPWLWTQPTVIWSGNNDESTGDTNMTMTNIELMVSDLLSVGNSNFIVLPMLISTNVAAGSTSYTFMEEMNTMLASTYAKHFVDIRATLLNSADPSNPTDVVDVANGWSPSSLRFDAIHLNAAGYKVVAARVMNSRLNGWNTKAIGLGQFYAAMAEHNLGAITTPSITFPLGSSITEVSPGTFDFIPGGTLSIYFGINGNENLGTSAYPLNRIYAKQLFVGANWVGVAADGNLQLSSSGTTIYASGKNLGSSIYPLGTVYASGISWTNGSYIAQSGDNSFNLVNPHHKIYMNGFRIGDLTHLLNTVSTTNLQTGVVAYAAGTTTIGANGPSFQDVGLVTNVIVTWQSNSVPPTLWASYYKDSTHRVDKMIVSFP